MCLVREKWIVNNGLVWRAPQESLWLDAKTRPTDGA